MNWPYKINTSLVAEYVFSSIKMEVVGFRDDPLG